MKLVQWAMEASQAVIARQHRTRYCLLIKHLSLLHLATCRSSRVTQIATPALGRARLDPLEFSFAHNATFFARLAKSSGDRERCSCCCDLWSASRPRDVVALVCVPALIESRRGAAAPCQLPVTSL